MDTAEGAALMGVPKERFTRLGMLVPVAFRPTRHRTVVWFYPADEVRQFADDPRNAHLLTGRTAGAPRGRLDAGLDPRPRNWRQRHLGLLLRRAGNDPWVRAGAVAALLAPLHLSRVVPDPHERWRVILSRPGSPVHGAPDSPSAALAREVVTAQDPDEIAWLRAELARLVAEARAHRPAPRPAPHARNRPLGAGGPRPAGRCAAPSAAAPEAYAGHPTPGPDGTGDRRPAVGLHRAEQTLLHHRDQQLSPPVVDPAAGQPASTRGHR
ncbi:DUF6397 family protein [Streptomyces sp. bgisy022]|uniref:DUF6397 family protein n=1 Tax=Streptomyces sp. bgisy022 TaxID=3413769 RepID=UPI003D708795